MCSDGRMFLLEGTIAITADDRKQAHAIVDKAYGGVRDMDGRTVCTFIGKPLVRKGRRYVQMIQRAMPPDHPGKDILFVMQMYFAVKAESYSDALDAVGTLTETLPKNDPGRVYSITVGEKKGEQGDVQ